MHKHTIIFSFFCCLPIFAVAQPTEDPWEGVNRSIYAFNDKADQWIVRPIAKGYRQVMPNFAERGISRFFANLNEVKNAANNLLQGKIGSAANSGGRFLINSTLGVAGFLDIADEMGISAEDGEDFGQTLAVWGVPSGPYLVLPFLGPSTLRDAPTRWVDYYVEPASYIEDQPTRNLTKALEFIALRASLLDADQTRAADPYLFIRDIWLQRREYLINDGEVEDDFSDGGFLDD